MIFKPEAVQDVLDAIQWYEMQREGLGRRLQRALDQVFLRIQTMPESARIVHNGVRRVLTRGFPFSVYYRLEEGEIVVFAVIDSRRDPKRWKSRI